MVAPVHRVHARHDLARPDVETHALARPERGRGVGQELARRVEHEGGLEEAREREHVAPLDRRALDALEVHRGALAGHRRRDGLAVRLDAAHLGLEPAGVDLDALVEGEPAGGDRAGHHRAEAPDREHAVDRQPEGGVGPARRAPRARARRAWRAAPAAPRRSWPRRAGWARPRGTCRARKPRTSSRTSSSQSGSARSALVSTTRPLRDPEQLADGEVLARLRHHPLVGRDDQHDEVDAARARRACSSRTARARARRRCRASARRPASRWAKPRSMVIPRSFSSLSRSGSIPVSARTRVDLPWSMWPAVPTTTWRTGSPA